MVDDNQQDAKSYSVQKNEPVRNLVVELKYPKEGEFLQTKEHHHHHHHHHQIMKNDMVRVCHVCNKGFSSGKALGGHMRIHFRQTKYKDLLVSKKKLNKFKKQNLRDIQASSEELMKSNIDFDDHMKMDKPVCAICGRDFPSMKSLFGHLRCHPDRGWRGLQPPQHGNEYRSSSFSSSSSLLDVEFSSDIEDHMEFNDVDYVSEKGSINLPESLSGGWMVTGKRGRKAAVVGSTSEASSSEEDELLYNAACDLMMLSCDLNTCNENKVGQVEVAKTRILEMDSVSKCKSKQKVDEVVEKNVVINKEDLENGDHLKMVMKNKKKIRKKVVKLCDLDRVEENGSTTLKHKLDVAANDKYRCNPCDRSFPSYQALGGHMSSHNKLIKVVFQNSIDVKHLAQVEEIEKLEKEGMYMPTNESLSQVVSPSDSSEMCMKGLDFDLNDKLPSDDEVGFGFEVNQH